MTLFEQIGGKPGLDSLLLSFYADVRQHAVLGPIFNDRIKDWPSHLAKIAEFWSLQTGGPSRYAGGFGAAHLRFPIEPYHFQHWLALWEFNCQRHLTPACAQAMIAIAHELGSRLRRIVESRPH